MKKILRFALLVNKMNILKNIFNQLCAFSSDMEWTEEKREDDTFPTDYIEFEYGQFYVRINKWFNLVAFNHNIILAVEYDGEIVLNMSYNIGYYDVKYFKPGDWILLFRREKIKK